MNTASALEILLKCWSNFNTFAVSEVVSVVKDLCPLTIKSKTKWLQVEKLILPDTYNRNVIVKKSF